MKLTVFHYALLTLIILFVGLLIFRVYRRRNRARKKMTALKYVFSPYKKRQ